MRRGFWFVAGAGAGVYAVFRARRAAEAFTPEGLGDRLRGLAAGAKVFSREVAQGRAEAESQLRERLGLVPHGIPELTPPPRPVGEPPPEPARHRATPTITEGRA